MTNIRHVLSANMKSHRKRLGLSQAQLAEKIGTATNYISKIEAEKQFPSVQMIEQISQALEVDTVDLFSIQSMKKLDFEEIKKSLIKQLNSSVEKAIEKIEEII